MESIERHYTVTSNPSTPTKPLRRATSLCQDMCSAGTPPPLAAHLPAEDHHPLSATQDDSGISPISKRAVKVSVPAASKRRRVDATGRALEPKATSSKLSLRDAFKAGLEPDPESPCSSPASLAPNTPPNVLRRKPSTVLNRTPVPSPSPAMLARKPSAARLKTSLPRQPSLGCIAGGAHSAEHPQVTGTRSESTQDQVRPLPSIPISTSSRRTLRKCPSMSLPHSARSSIPPKSLIPRSTSISSLRHHVLQETPALMKSPPRPGVRPVCKSLSASASMPLASPLRSLRLSESRVSTKSTPDLRRLALDPETCV